MSKFVLEEAAIAIGRGSPKECEIIKVLPIRRGKQYYLIFVPSLPSPAKDKGWVIAERCLRKKKPPEKDASWEQVQEIIGWNPIKEKVHV